MNNNMYGGPVPKSPDWHQGYKEGLEIVEDVLRIAVKRLKREVRKDFIDRHLGWTDTHKCDCGECPNNV